jgi:hypothetical protein
MARRGKGSAGKLLVVQSIRTLLRVVGANWDSSLYGFTLMVTIEPVLILVLLFDSEVRDRHFESVGVNTSGWNW